jgi:hypothetical protein
VPAHVALNERIKMREGPNAAYGLGERIPFVVIAGPPKSKPTEFFKWRTGS